MKQPKRPTEPYAPYKPIEPKKTVTANTLLSTKCIDTYDKYSVEQLFGSLSEDVKIEFEIEDTWNYDDYTHSIIAHVYSSKEIPDPNYDKNYKTYLKSMEKYKEDQKKFKEKKKQYKLDIEKYNLEFDKWLLESKKRQVKSLEERLAKSQNV